MIVVTEENEQYEGFFVRVTAEFERNMFCNDETTVWGNGVWFLWQQLYLAVLGQSENFFFLTYPVHYVTRQLEKLSKPEKAISEKIL